MISKFGVGLRVVIERGGKLILDTALGDGSNSLRVDCHLKDIPGMRKAKVEIYNLAPVTSSSAIQMGNRVTIYTRLHNEQWTNMGGFIVTNAESFRDVPDGITRLYCQGSVWKNFFKAKVNISVSKPSLPKVLSSLARESGQNISFNYIDFHSKHLSYVPPSGHATFSGTVEDAMRRLGRMYNFRYYERTNGKVTIIHDLKGSEEATRLDTDRGRPIILRNRDMRGNPKITVAALDIDANFNPSIRPGSSIDTGVLISKESGVGFDTLALAGGISAIQSRYYRVLTSEHTISNFTDMWTTRCKGVAASNGRRTPTW